MGRYARKKGKAASCKGIGRRGGKTKTKTRDLDQIQADLIKGKPSPEHLESLTDRPAEEGDLSHLYCISCARLFQSDEILVRHLRSKTHKRRLKKLKEWPAESEQQA